jgi:superfamily II DNA helicase RecQ
MNGFDSKSYHAGLMANDRQQRQKNFINNKVRIIVATVAFGMGINKPDVSAVIHFSLPRSLEGNNMFIQL